MSKNGEIFSLAPNQGWAMFELGEALTFKTASAESEVRTWIFTAV